MRIVHISLRGPYTDNWGYQENILPRIQKRQGHEVFLIAESRKFNFNGEIIQTSSGEYTQDDGVKVIRLNYRSNWPMKRLSKLFTPYKLFDMLSEISPDLIMVHCLGTGMANVEIWKYVHKNKEKCTLVGDTHEHEEIADPYPKQIKVRFIKFIQKSMYKVLFSNYKTIFGTTPNRIEFAVKHYKTPVEKMKFLPLGYDPVLCNWDKRDMIKKEFRNKLSIADDDLLIIHGGKIENRRKTPETILAIKALNNPKIKLIVFGVILDEMKEQVEKLINDNHAFVNYLGHLKPSEYYNAFLSSDIALFPGGHSVLWHEAIGCGLPLIVGAARNLDYLDRGGNVKIIQDVTINGISHALQDIIYNKRYLDMAKIAANSGRDFFSYERIANIVNDCVMNKCE